MASPDDLAVGVDEHAMWYVPYIVKFPIIVLAVFEPVVLYTGPLMVSDVLLKRLLVLVDVESDDANVLPSAQSVLDLQHFLKLGHRLKARGTPGGPEFQQDDLSSLVVD